MAAEKFDLVVIGAGPGGYVASIRASQLGMKVACVDRRSTLGGTCLNVGCIPSKALLNASEQFAKAKDGTLADLGISVGTPKLDLGRMQAFKDEIVSSLTGGIDYLFKKNKITRLEGPRGLIRRGGSALLMARTKTAISATVF